MPPLSAYAWVALGSALGGVLRYLLNAWMALRTGEQFPWGTLLVNITGSFFIGWFAATWPAGGRPLGLAHGRDLLMAGVCGGYTTFSAFSLQTVLLWQRGDRALAGAYVGSSVALCLGAAILGLWCGTRR